MPPAADTAKVHRHSGHTGRQLADVDVHITASAPDLLCWLWAAFPQHRGRMPTSKIAETLGVSPSTVRRWVQLSAKEQRLTRAKASPLNEAGMRILRRRAILRGRGHYLWPHVDQATLNRSEKNLAMATAGRRDFHTLGPTQRDIDTGRTNAHYVHLVHYPRAHVYALATAQVDESTQRLWRRGEILQTIQTTTYWDAMILKETGLAQVSEHRCITPAELIPSGRTETWLEAAGPLIDLERLSHAQDEKEKPQ